MSFVHQRRLMFFTSLLLATIMGSITTPLIAEQRIESPKMELSVSQTDYLDKLEKEESNGSTTIKVLDINNRYSMGCLQYQSETFLTYGKLYGLVATSTKKAEPLIYNCELQRQLAHKMLLDGGESHWLNTVKYLHLGEYPKD